MEIEKVVYNNAKARKIADELHQANKKITQLSLAKEMGLTVQQMFYPNPTARNIGLIASVFKVEPNKLFDITWNYDIEEFKNSIVKIPLTDYTLNDDATKEDLYKLLYEQQVEITKLMEENAKLLKLLNK